MLSESFIKRDIGRVRAPKYQLLSRPEPITGTVK
jgi:hypothetical protein